MAQDNTTICINGELKPGDYVLSTPNDDYACLIGTVTGINKAGSPEHDAETDNPGDDVHVNFMDSGYSDRRISEIEEMFSDLYGEDKSYDDCPIDDVIMAPDMLIRITGIGRDELDEILDSGENAAAYCRRVIEKEYPIIMQEFAVPETRTQAALREPYAPDSRVAALQEKLMERLDSNLSDYFAALRDKDGNEIIAMCGEITATTGAYLYLAEMHTHFYTKELDMFLQYKNPLKVAADACQEVGLDYADAVYGALAIKPLQSGYELTADVSGAALGPQSNTGIGTVRPSVMDQIRRARSEAKENPAPHKESPTKDKGREI